MFERKGEKLGSVQVDPNSAESTEPEDDKVSPDSDDAPAAPEPTPEPEPEPAPAKKAPAKAAFKSALDKSKE